MKPQGAVLIAVLIFDYSAAEGYITFRRRSEKGGEDREKMCGCPREKIQKRTPVLEKSKCLSVV
jgi:hypothetical protein